MRKDTDTVISNFNPKGKPRKRALSKRKVRELAALEKEPEVFREVWRLIDEAKRLKEQAVEQTRRGEHRAANETLKAENVALIKAVDLLETEVKWLPLPPSNA